MSRILIGLSMLAVLGFGVFSLVSQPLEAASDECYVCMYDFNQCVIEASQSGPFHDTLYSICLWNYEDCMENCIEDPPF